tara:strand:+ start:206 stop:820 length:615 start_codon:yes stop_codon:yes gene_type:complete
MTIVYMDECARGVFFGSVYAGAVIWPDNVPIEPPVSIKSWDSKRISAKKREVLFEYIKDNCAEWAVGIANSKEIDENNILNATMIAFHRALDSLKCSFDEIYVDGSYFQAYLGKDDFIPHTCVIKGDSIHDEIGMASIIAKVSHDKYIKDLCQINPDLDEKYNLLNNMGYGTKKHIEGILKHGFTEHHRRSFKIKQIPNSYYQE